MRAGGPAVGESISNDHCVIQTWGKFPLGTLLMCKPLTLSILLYIYYIIFSDVSDGQMHRIFMGWQCLSG